MSDHVCQHSVLVTFNDQEFLGEVIAPLSLLQLLGLTFNFIKLT